MVPRRLLNKMTIKTNVLGNNAKYIRLYCFFPQLYSTTHHVSFGWAFCLKNIQLNVYSSGPAFVVAGPMCPQHSNGGTLLTVIISGMSLMCLVKVFSIFVR